jgi:site-specific DNA-cytosine methylase
MAKILLACEESQAVTIEFRKLGHEAFSCDLMPCSGGHPEWHIQGDVTEVLKQKWDLIIAFPPCTHLAVSGNAHRAKKQKDGREQQAIDFFMIFAKHPCVFIAIENPVGIMSTKWRKPNQVIQPYEYGHPESKKTCLWLKNLPNLTPTKILPTPKNGRWDNQTMDGQNRLLVNGKWIAYNDPRTAMLRSKTYKGIAKAMAKQWSQWLNLIEELKKSDII